MPENWLFLLLEVYVNLALLIEVLLRFSSQQKVFLLALTLTDEQDYFRFKGNWFDLFVLLCSIVAMGLLLSGNSAFDKAEESVTIFLLSVRYVIVVLRVLSLLKKYVLSKLYSTYSHF